MNIGDVLIWGYFWLQWLESTSKGNWL